MATDSRTKPGKRSSSKPIRYFYLNSDLHRVLRVTRPADLVEAWNFREGKRVTYVWSDVRKRMERAFTLQEVCKLIGRHRVQIENYILDGKIRAPQRIYSLDENRTPGKYYFSESDVLGVHDFLLTVHIGRPRRDGKVTPGKMPTKAELRALMKHDVMTYIKTDDNEFRPVWKEVEW